MAIPIIKAVLVIIMLGLMIIILLGIHHFFSGSFETDNSEIDDMRVDIRESDEVITGHSVFSDLVKVRQSASRGSGGRKESELE